MRSLMILIAVCVSSASIALAQDCWTAVQEEIWQTAIEEAERGRCQIRCEGCGCKGGPGYRDPETRQCVGWGKLENVCGPYPHSLCKAECTPVTAACELPEFEAADEDAEPSP